MRSNVSEDNLSSRLLATNYCGVRRKKDNDVDAKSAEIEKLKVDLRDSQDENLKLQAVISDLTQVNKRWQKYNSDRQIYVQKLLNTIQDQQEQLNKMGEQRAFSNTEEDQDLGRTKKNYEQELDRLQETEMILKEKIQVLEFQVKANRDDWEAELNEKKQVLKEKADIEGKVKILMDELQELKQSILQKQRNMKRNICDICRLGMSNELPQPGNRLFRTAVHLPCSSQNWRGGMSEGATNSCNLETDGTENTANTDYLLATRLHFGAAKRATPLRGESAEADYDSGLPRAESIESNDVTDVWNIGEHWRASTNIAAAPEATPSYSRASTVPLVSSPVIHVTPSNSSSSVTFIDSVPHHEDAYGVKYRSRAPDSPSICSVVQIPVTKSSSAPENKSWSSSKSFRSSADSLDPLSDSASCADSAILDASNSNDHVNGTSSSRQNIICPVCQSAFAPENNLKFLDHFEACQRNV